MIVRVLLAILVCLPSLVSRAQDGVETRLTQLRPDEPMGYFLLAESIAYEHADRESQALARRLFVLALHLDEQRETPLGLASSVCFALADLAGDETERHWLLSIGESRVRDAERVVWNPSLSLESPEDERYRYQLVEAILRQLDGSPRKAIELSRDDQLPAFLTSLKTDLPEGSIARFIERLGQNTTCPECRNRRVSRDSSGRMRVCRTCDGDPGTHSMRRNELLEMLRFQANLLVTNAGTWGGDLLLQGDAPMHTLRADEIAPRYAIDTDRVIYRSGRWVASDVPEATLDPPASGEYDGGPGSRRP